MTHSIRKAAVVLGCAAAALGLGMASASAATTFTVKAGSAPTGTTVAITGTTTGSSPQITFVDTTTGTSLSCASGTAPGSTKTGTGLAGAKLGTINGAGAKFNSCTGPLGLNLVVTGSGTWTINGVSGNANAVNGTIGAVKATVKDTGGNCSFSVAGSVKGQVVNSNSTLVLPGTTSTLKISNVVGCFGVVNSGDVASFKATYALKATNAAYNPVKVTAP